LDHRAKSSRNSLSIRHFSTRSRYTLPSARRSSALASKRRETVHRFAQKAWLHSLSDTTLWGFEHVKSFHALRGVGKLQKISAAIAATSPVTARTNVDNRHHAGEGTKHTAAESNHPEDAIEWRNEKCNVKSFHTAHLSLLFTLSLGIDKISYQLAPGRESNQFTEPH
jgi:hypothetical protein